MQMEYIDDNVYNYAILIDGEWGCGKTYFVKNDLFKKLENEDRMYKYISLYSCNTIEDIQKKLIGLYIEEYLSKQKVVRKVMGKVKLPSGIGKTMNMLTNIADSLMKSNGIDSPIYKGTLELISKDNSILVFDDLERCNCKINETLSFLNDLIEQSNKKVIIIANEREINNTNINIEGDSNQPHESNERIQYLRTKEKMIGGVYKFEADLNFSISQIIEKQEFSNGLDELKNRIDIVTDTMGRYAHNNLRTFLFLLSKYKNIMAIVETKKECNFYKLLVDTIFKELLVYCILYKKGNNKLASDENEVVYCFRSLRHYVYSGDLNKERLDQEIVDWFVRKERETQDKNDPLKKLQSNYYRTSQIECEQLLDEIINRLKEDYYQLADYREIICLFVKLIEFGISDTCLQTLKEIMLDKVTKMNMDERIDSDFLFSMDDGSGMIVHDKSDELAYRIINELNVALDMSGANLSTKSIIDILSLEGKEWLDQLWNITNIYINGLGNKKIDVPVFVHLSAQKWCEKLIQLEVESLHDFHGWLKGYYPYGCDKNSYVIDQERIIELYKCLDPEKEKDVIKKQNIKWLKHYIKELLASHNTVIDENIKIEVQ